MRLFILLVLVLATAAFSVQLYRLTKQLSYLKSEIVKVNQRTTPIEQENRKLRADLEYFQRPGRLGNELRRSGYAKPEEKMIIIIPKE